MILVVTWMLNSLCDICPKLPAVLNYLHLYPFNCYLISTGVALLMISKDDYAFRRILYESIVQVCINIQILIFDWLYNCPSISDS